MGRKFPSGVQGRSTGRGLKLFVKLHIIFALKYNKQQLLLLLDKINLAAKYKISKILGGRPLCPIRIDAHDLQPFLLVSI